MSRAGVRAGVAIFVVGLLFIWLVRPIGSACPDVDKLPSGSEGSSAPSFAPPLTRTCTYTTPDGTKARKRYVPLLDLVALLFVSGVVGGAIGMAGPGGRERRARSQRAPAPERAPLPEPDVWPALTDEPSQEQRDGAERERARREREARRRG